MTVWTDEQIEKLTSMYAAGKTFSMIGAALGVSRNACIGKAHRLKLPEPESKQVRRKAAPRPKPAQRRYMTFARTAGSALRLIESVTSIVPEFECEVISLNKTLDDLGRDDCRFIAGDPLANGPALYCGRKIYRRHYCEHHFLRCYTEPMKRWARAA